MKEAVLILVSALCCSIVVCIERSSRHEDPSAYMKKLNEMFGKQLKEVREANWAYVTNITKDNLDRKLHADSKFLHDRRVEWSVINLHDWKSFRDVDLRRQFKFFSNLDTAALSDEDYQNFTSIVDDMKKNFWTAKICDYYVPSMCNLLLKPDIEHIVLKSHNVDELQHVWVERRQAVGLKVKELYPKYVELANKAARLNHYSDRSEYWLDMYETENIKEHLKNMWDSVQPLYVQIHAYLRYKLRQRYGSIVSETDPIPDHLFGDVWDLTSNNVINFTLPYPDQQNPPITDNMFRRGFTPLKIVQTANDFLTSLNLTGMPELFWNKSIIEEPQDPNRKFSCQFAVYGVSENDVRIKQCTRVDFEDLLITHQQITQSEYYLQYAKQPAVYQRAAVPGFHEAIGDTIALSVSTAKHLKRIGLFEDSVFEEKTSINNLFKLALQRIAALPAAYVLDLWRWDIFANKTPKSEWNRKWWELKHQYQGVKPPFDRPEYYIDPAAEYYIVADEPSIKYFIAYVVEFQFHRALCLKAGEYVPNDPEKPLHQCDIYGSIEAGKALGDAFRLGASKPWPEVIKALSGQIYMDTSALLEYFKPLYEWLIKENGKNGVSTGWGPEFISRNYI